MPRGSKPGERRGGRAAGTPNRRTAELAERLAELGCDPLEGLVRIAMDPGTEVGLRAKVLGDLMPYLFPRRRSVEVKTEQGSFLDAVPTRVLVELERELAERCRTVEHRDLPQQKLVTLQN